MDEPEPALRIGGDFDPAQAKPYFFDADFLEPGAVQWLMPCSIFCNPPYSYRKVGARPTLRELIVPFGSTGYVLRFDIRTPELVLVLGARHQREQDYH